MNFIIAGEIISKHKYNIGDDANNTVFDLLDFLDFLNVVKQAIFDYKMALEVVKILPQSNDMAENAILHQILDDGNIELRQTAHHKEHCHGNALPILNRFKFNRLPDKFFLPSGTSSLFSSYAIRFVILGRFRFTTSISSMSSIASNSVPNKRKISCF